jgi:hypothetical protein
VVVYVAEEDKPQGKEIGFFFFSYIDKTTKREKKESHPY